MRILVIGWYDKGNAGDEAYKIAFRESFPSHEITFVGAPSNLNDFDAIIVGGGDVLNDQLLDQLQDSTAPIYAFSVSTNHKVSFEKLKVFKHIFVRDTQSWQGSLPVSYMPDLTFKLSPNKDRGEEVLRAAFHKKDRYNTTVGVVVNAHLFSDYDRRSSAGDQIAFQKFTYDFSWITDHSPYSFVFIPFGTEMPWDDRASNAYVASRSKFWKKNAVIYDAQSADLTLDTIAACDMVVSTRLHASIFSTIAGVPFLDITHNHKNTWYLESIDWKHWSLPYRRFELNSCKERLNCLHSNRYSLSEALKQITNEQRSRIDEAMSNVSLC